MDDSGTDIFSQVVTTQPPGIGGDGFRPHRVVPLGTMIGVGLAGGNNFGRVIARPWKQGVFQCHKNPLSCFLGLFCPCLHFCWTVRRAGEDPVKYFCLNLCGIPSIVALRSTVRAKHGIKGDFIDDAVCGTCCGACVLCQVENEVRVSTAAGGKE